MGQSAVGVNRRHGVGTNAQHYRVGVDHRRMNGQIQGDYAVAAMHCRKGLFVVTRSIIRTVKENIRQVIFAHLGKERIRHESRIMMNVERDHTVVTVKMIGIDVRARRGNLRTHEVYGRVRTNRCVYYCVKHLIHSKIQ